MAFEKYFYAATKFLKYFWKSNHILLERYSIILSATTSEKRTYVVLLK